MKKILAKLAEKTRGWPVIGEAVRIVGALLQLPMLRDRQRLFEEQQLPNLLRTISELNHRQLTKDHGDVTNLVRSVPISLRRTARDMSGLQQKFETLSEQLDRHISETQRQLEGMVGTLEWRLEETNKQLKAMTDPLEWRLDEAQSQLQGMAGTLEWRLDETKNQLKAMTDRLEWRLDETQGRLDGFASAASYSASRIEFVRRELMYEMRYGSAKGSADHSPLTAHAQILAPEKVEAARNGLLRLNLGCGHIPLEGYVNIDRRPLAGVDVVSEAEDLPFEKEEVDEIYSAHMLEHFPQEQIRRELLHYWMGLLKCGGKFRAVVPDAEAMIRGYAEGSYPYSDLREVTFGSQDYDGDFHYNMFTPDSLTELLLEAGFESIEIMAESRKNGACLEFEVQAIKPKSAA